MRYRRRFAHFGADNPDMRKATRSPSPQVTASPTDNANHVLRAGQKKEAEREEKENHCDSQKQKCSTGDQETQTFALLARRSNQLSYSSTDFLLRQRRKRIFLGCHSTRHKLLLQLECCNEGSHRRTDLCTMRDYSNSRKPSCKSAWSGVIVLGFSFSSRRPRSCPSRRVTIATRSCCTILPPPL